MRAKKISLVALVSASVLALTACGGGSSTSSGGAATGSSVATQSAEPGDSPGLSAAKAYLEPFLAGPSTINIDAPLSKKPDAGKTLIGLNSGLPSAVVLSKYWKQAAEDLGWTYKDLISGVTPEDQQKAMDAAIQQKPDGILTSGIPIATIQAQLKQAEEKGIWVNTSASTDKPAGAFFDTSIADPKQLAEWGRMIAASAIVDTQGKGKFQLFSLPVFPILLEFDNAFKAAVKEWCPDCQVTENPQQGADIGTKTPGAVVSALQKAPDTDWIIFDLGDLSTGVPAALAAAGLEGTVKVGGLTATTANTAAVKAGKESAWTAYSLPIVAYRQVDSFARKFNGDPIVEAGLPTQVITPDNVGALVVEGGGSYLGVADYREQFKKLWLQ